MTSLNRTEHNKTQNEDFLFRDFIQFLRDNWRFLGLTTAALSIVSITISLLQPKQYQKHLALSVQPFPVTLSTAPTAQSLPDLDVIRTSNLTVTMLQKQLPDQIAAIPKYDIATQQIDLTLRSPNLNALRAADSKLLNYLAVGWQKILKETVEASLTRIDIELGRSQEILAELEKQIAQTPNNAPSVVPNPRMEGLEAQRSIYVAKITALEFDKEYLEKAERSPTEFTAQVIHVKILTESEVQQTSSLLKLAVLAVIASFMVAVLATIIRDQVIRLKSGLSQKFDSKGDI